MMYLNRNNALFAILNKFYFMFCTEFLIKNSLLSITNGRPIGMHKFVTYFQNHEPSNLAFAFLVQKYSMSDELNSSLEDDDELLDIQILVLMAHLFNRIPIYDVEAVRKECKINTWNSKVILEDICDEFKKPLREFNGNTHAIFKANLFEQSELFDSELDRLPLSKYDYRNNSDNKGFRLSF